ncbi:hypothetical protein JYG30_19740 [Fibrella sp. USSR17]
MKLFLQTSHKLIVFLLFITVWTDLILPNPYKSSELVFWIFCLFVMGWYYFAYNALAESNSVEQFRIPFYVALFVLTLAMTLQTVFGVDTAHIGEINISVWRLLCYIFLAFVITKLLLSAEGEVLISLKGITTFLLIFILPIGAWWIHQRIQRVVSGNRMTIEG